MHWYIGPKLIGARQVLAFQERHPDRSPAAMELVGRLLVVVEVLTGLFAERAGLQRELKETREARGRVEGVLRGLMGQLALMFRVLAKQDGVAVPAMVAQRDRGAPTLIRGVAAAISAAEQHRERLIHYGLPATLIRDLVDRFDEYDAHEEERVRCEAALLEISARLEEAGAEATRLVFHLDALNRIRFAADAARLAEWRGARSVAAGRAGVGRSSGAEQPVPPGPNG